MARARKKKPMIQAVELVCPTEAQAARFIPDFVDPETGKQVAQYERDEIIHAESFTRATVHRNRGGTPIMRWTRKGMLTHQQLAAIEWCQRLWHISTTTPRLAAAYGERITGADTVELAAIKVLAADQDLTRFKSHVPRNAWGVFENVCRWGMSAGIAGWELGYGTRTAEARAHQTVCIVADTIAEKERI